MNLKEFREFMRTLSNEDIHRIASIISLIRAPIPKCPQCGGPVESVRHIEQGLEYANGTATPEFKGDEPVVKEALYLSALCKHCGWESARSEPCCEEHWK